MNNVDNIKEMAFESQADDDDYPDKKREKMGLIDKNLPQSHNYTERAYPKN